MTLPYTPHLVDLADIVITWLIAIVLTLAGRRFLGRASAPELRLIAGWGMLCILLTLWGVTSSLSLGWPSIGFALWSFSTLTSASNRPSRADLITAGRLLVLTLPMWLIFAPIRPSQPDTFLNLLPNAAYLTDHGFLPADSLPDAHSFLPGAPYNTQFASFLGTLLRRDFLAHGMSLFNLLLQLAAAIVLARAFQPHERRLDGRQAPSWAALAAGFLAATALNPGFVPRISLAGYGESGLDVTALFATLLMLRAGKALSSGEGPTSPLALGLILTAMINIKQSGIGLVVALAVAFCVYVALRAPANLRKGLRFLASALLLPICLYVIWRFYVQTHFVVGELKPLPFGAWQWDNIPRIAASISAIMLQKPVFFLPALVVAFAGIVLAIRRYRSPGADAALFFAALLVAYNGFLVLTYIAHFPGEMSTDAHSYFRYNTHLALVLVFAAVLLLREIAFVQNTAERWPRVVGIGVIVLALATPIAFAKRLRFDRDLPQPLVWDLGKHVAPYLGNDSKLALLLPGDNGSVAPMLEAVLRDTAPRRPDLNLLIRNIADAAALQGSLAAGYDLVLVSCTDPLIGEPKTGLPALAPRSAALLRHVDGSWKLVASWPYDASAYRTRWQHILAFAPLCRAEANSP